VQAATPDALAARIREVIMSDSETLRRVVTNARQAWERSYQVADYQSRIMNLVEQLVSTR
jgi:hypothetical protein